jgi:glycosyltransferase involved in cell wall biosynthesis
VDYKFQIVTVVKDDEEGLRRTLRSIEDQSVEDFKISILVVDGSRDDCVRAATAEYADLDITYVHVLPSGVYHAMNYALGVLQRSEIRESARLVFMNAGDFFLQKDALKIVKSQGAAFPIVVTQAVKYRPSPNGYLAYPLANLGSEKDFLNPMVFWLPHQGFFATWEVYKSVGRFDLSYQIASDYEFIRRAVLSFPNIRVVQDFLVVQVVDGLSNRKSYSGYKERIRLTKTLDYKIRRLPFNLVVKMFLKEYMPNQLGRIMESPRFQKSNHGANFRERIEGELSVEDVFEKYTSV